MCKWVCARVSEFECRFIIHEVCGVANGDSVVYVSRNPQGIRFYLSLNCWHLNTFILRFVSSSERTIWSTGWRLVAWDHCDWDGRGTENESHFTHYLVFLISFPPFSFVIILKFPDEASSFSRKLDESDLPHQRRSSSHSQGPTQTSF